MKNGRKTLVAAAALLTLGWSQSRGGKLSLRRLAAALTGSLLRIRGRSLPIGGFASVMVVAPHPDDEAFGCGGALLLAAKGGTKVHVLFITDGDASHPGHPLLDPSAIAAMRRSEARSSGAALGVEAGRLVFLGAPDGRLTELAADPGGSLSGRIAEQLIATRPDAVFLPSRRDGSSEHEAAFAIVQGALVRAGISPRVFEFPVWSLWDSSLLFPSAFTARSVWRVGLDGLRESKARAIGCYVSQLQPLAPDLCSAVPEGFAPMFLGSNEFFFEH